MPDAGCRGSSASASSGSRRSRGLWAPAAASGPCRRQRSPLPSGRGQGEGCCPGQQADRRRIDVAGPRPIRRTGKLQHLRLRPLRRIQPRVRSSSNSFAAADIAAVCSGVGSGNGNVSKQVVGVYRGRFPGGSHVAAPKLHERGNGERQKSNHRRVQRHKLLSGRISSPARQTRGASIHRRRKTNRFNLQARAATPGRAAATATIARGSRSSWFSSRNGRTCSSTCANGTRKRLLRRQGDLRKVNDPTTSLTFTKSPPR